MQPGEQRRWSNSASVLATREGSQASASAGLCDDPGMRGIRGFERVGIGRHEGGATAHRIAAGSAIDVTRFDDLRRVPVEFEDDGIVHALEEIVLDDEFGHVAGCDAVPAIGRAEVAVEDVNLPMPDAGSVVEESLRPPIVVEGHVDAFRCVRIAVPTHASETVLTFLHGVIELRPGNRDQVRTADDVQVAVGAVEKFTVIDPHAGRAVDFQGIALAGDTAAVEANIFQNLASLTKLSSLKTTLCHY